MSRAELARNAGAITKSGRLDIHSVSRACGDLQRAGLLTIQQARGGKNTYLLGPLTPLFDLAAVTPTRRNGPTPTRRTITTPTRRNGPTPVKEDEEGPQNHQAPDSEVLRESEPPADAASPDGFHNASDVAEQLYAVGVCRGPSDTFAERAPALRAFVAEHGEATCRQALAELPPVEAPATRRGQFRAPQTGGVGSGTNPEARHRSARTAAIGGCSRPDHGAAALAPGAVRTALRADGGEPFSIRDSANANRPPPERRSTCFAAIRLQDRCVCLRMVG